MSSGSDHVVYVDESGDHGLQSIDPEYPLFVLVFCLFRAGDYADRVCPSLASFKFRYFGHDGVVLHERDIRKALPPFQSLVNPDTRSRFLGDLTAVVHRSPFQIIASVIRKARLRDQYSEPANVYDLALGFGLERLTMELEARGHGTVNTHVLLERRGRQEDSQLELEFRRVCDGANLLGRQLPLLPVFVDKRANLPGLQLADLVARPIGQHVLHPEKRNRAFETIRDKLRRSPSGKVEGWGLKCFP
jgi:hypothetical protein